MRVLAWNRGPSGSATMRLAAALGILLGTGSVATAQTPPATIRTEVSLVNVIFSVLDRTSRPITGLSREDFLVFEDRKPQKIEYFSRLNEGSELPLTIALLIDTSGSVRSKLEYEKLTAAEFLRTVMRRNQDQALVIQFDSDVRLIQDYTDDPEILVRALETLEAGNSTSLYDAIYLAVEERLKGEAGRKIIVAITDGDDTSSKLSKEQAIEAAQRSDVLIYGIGVRSPEFGSNFGVLKKFAEETGGGFFSPRARMAEIQTAFKAISEDLKGQYSLAYTPDNKNKDGRFRSIEVRCKIGGVRVRSRKGYYAPRATP